MNQDNSSKYYMNIMWIITITFTGITTGFYLSHSLVLGPWYTWFATTPGKLPLLYQTYTEFRAVHTPVAYYLISILQVCVLIAFTIISVIKKNNARLAVIALLSSLCAGVIHIATGFSTLEVDFVTGVELDPVALAKFASLNVPLHLTYAILMLITFILLCVYIIRNQEQ